MGSGESVLDFILLRELLIGEEFFLEGEEDVVSFRNNLVSEVKIAGRAKIGLGLE